MTRAKRKKWTNIEDVGDWIEIGHAKVYGQAGERYSVTDIMLRQQYQLAMQGDRSAVDTVLKMMDAVITAREEVCWQPVKIIRGGVDEGEKLPRNADMALLILGICSVDDASLNDLGRYGGTYDKGLEQLRPDRIEPWVVDCAQSRITAKSCGDQTETSPEKRLALANASEVSQWRENKSELLSALMRVRGPGASRFKPGKSGNPRGRPPRYHDKHPYEDFFMELISIKVGTRWRKVTRLDGLMHQVMMLAAKGDQRLARVILPKLMKHAERKWAAIPERPPIIRGEPKRKKRVD